MKIRELELYLNGLLEIDRFQDYCPNGLQVQGRTEIKHIVTGVTASLALIEKSESTWSRYCPGTSRLFLAQ